MKQTQQLSCACGQVHLEAVGSPIISVECYCDSCRAAGARLQTLPSAPHMLEADGGTRQVLMRKDRIRFSKGAPLLKEFHLTPNSSTRRVIATCCNSPVFMEFKGAHWLNLYGSLWPDGTLPPLELRTMTIDLPAETSLPDNVPNAKRQSVSFFARILIAWAAMGFRSPKISVNGEISV